MFSQQCAFIDPECYYSDGGTDVLSYGVIASTAVTTFGDTLLAEAENIVVHDPGTKELYQFILLVKATPVKILLIFTRFEHTISDTVLGFSRSGTVHENGNLFTSIKYHLNTEQGWFNPYFFTSCQRSNIPKPIKPDVVFCHGPFLLGDYYIAETLVTETPSNIIDPVGDITVPPASKSSVVKASEKASELGHGISSCWYRTASPAPVEAKRLCKYRRPTIQSSSNLTMWNIHPIFRLSACLLRIRLLRPFMSP
ncbi:hypothetical protein RSOLAG1IB_05242 [Rhizoctonia solani AG-1 IB]|uniref:Uncharacterized protein n=1 Tax=Thanatephorus cucumeris (strain AG1-IB / isolate 7/3/14) TaxID=1108050 RepID=A0A0B7FZS9_THACB|nr:hypothetical protein RSOLAG1IB_05242 [Rhizoctonia solani AG-1 IB]